MAELILVDTNVLIDFERGSEKTGALLAHLEEAYELGISIVTHMEMIIGCRNNRELANAEKIAHRFGIHTVTPAIAQIALDLLRQYRLSHGLLIPDALIAATAFALQIPLLTANQRDFRFIEGIRCLPYP